MRRVGGSPTVEVVAIAAVRLAIVDDYDVIVAGVARLFEPFGDRVTVVELDALEPVTSPVDVALVDTFAQYEASGPDIDPVLANPLAEHVALYTWHFDDGLVDEALRRGAHGYLSKALRAGELVRAIERIAGGEVVVVGPDGREPGPPGLDWPGRARGLTERESEAMALLTQGLTNRDIAERMFISVNSVKTHLRHAYHKLGLRRRAQAAAWGMAHGMSPNRDRLAPWAVQPASSDRTPTSADITHPKG